jgi:hypothetical protein
MLEERCSVTMGNSSPISRGTGCFAPDHSVNLQGTFMSHSGNIQAPFREHSGSIQGTFRPHSGNIQTPFREHSGPIQGILLQC